ncbi:MAG: transcription antitermination factor NusB [Nitriliruptoraceae bacterium]
MAGRHRSHTAPRRSDTHDPAWSRERALRILFQADLRGVEPSVTLARVEADEAARALLDEHDRLAEEEPILPAADTSGGTAGPGSGGRPVRDGTSDAGGSTTATGAQAGGGASASGWSEVAGRTAAPIDGFTRSLVLGVERDRDEVETLISRYSRRWAIPRMPVVDRNVLRLATYELLRETTPPAVVLNEAVALAKRLSTEDSGRFINGVLESIRQEIARVPADPASDDRDAG